MRSLKEPGRNHQPEEIGTISKAGVRCGRGDPVNLAAMRQDVLAGFLHRLAGSHDSI